MLIALAFMVWRKKRRIDRHPDVHGDEFVQQTGASTKHRLRNTHQHQNVAELDSQPKIELEPQIAPQELDGSAVVVSERPREA